MFNRITNSPIADIFIIWAKCDDGDVRGFIVERNSSSGIATPKIEGKFSLRSSVTGMIHLDHVEIPKENLLPGVAGLKVCITASNKFSSLQCECVCNC